MHDRTNNRLSAADRSELEAVAANRNSPQKHVWRAKIVLLTADGHGAADIMRAAGKAKTVIWRWQERFGKEGVAGLWRDKTRPSRIPPLRPEVAERVVALTLAGPPPTASHWTGAAMAKATGISVSSVQRIWRTHGLRPHLVRRLTIPNSRPSSERSSASTSTRPTTPSFSRSMRKAKSRPWTAPSRGCR
jgi:transposase